MAWAYAIPSGQWLVLFFGRGDLPTIASSCFAKCVGMLKEPYPFGRPGALPWTFLLPLEGHPEPMRIPSAAEGMVIPS